MAATGAWPCHRRPPVSRKLLFKTRRVPYIIVADPNSCGSQFAGSASEFLGSVTLEAGIGACKLFCFNSLNNGSSFIKDLIKGKFVENLFKTFY